MLDGTSVTGSSAPCEPAPALDGEQPPVPLALPAGSVVTDVTEIAGQRLVTGRVSAEVSDVLEHFRLAAEPAGFVVQRDEDEGRAGELLLFGVRGDVGITVARLACPRGDTGFTVAVAQPASVG